MCRSRGAEAQEANYLWREAIKLRRLAKDEAVRSEVSARKAASASNLRCATKSFRIRKTTKGIKDRSKIDAQIIRDQTIKDAAKIKNKF